MRTGCHGSIDGQSLESGESVCSSAPGKVSGSRCRGMVEEGGDVCHDVSRAGYARPHDTRGRTMLNERVGRCMRVCRLGEEDVCDALLQFCKVPRTAAMFAALHSIIETMRSPQNAWNRRSSVPRAFSPECDDCPGEGVERNWEDSGKGLGRVWEGTGKGVARYSQATRKKWAGCQSDGCCRLESVLSML